MTNPRVSVIVPCFDLGPFLADAVDSVLAQTVDDYEVLVGDDGSTDEETRRILAQFTRPKTRVFRFPHRGLAATRNALIAEARGTFLCALDADDRLRSTYLERTLSAFDTDPGLTFVSTRLEMFGIQSGTWPATLRCDLAALLHDDTVHTAALVRREAVLAAGGYDERMPAQGDEDWDLWISLVERGARGRILDDVLFDYRRREGSMLQHCQRPAVHRSQHDYLVEKHADAYRTHWREVVTAQEASIAELRSAIVALEASTSRELSQAIASRTRELGRLRTRLDAARVNRERDAALSALHDEMRVREAAASDRERELEALHAEYTRALAEVRALRASLSWRLTGPLRAVYDRMRRQES